MVVVAVAITVSVSLSLSSCHKEAQQEAEIASAASETATEPTTEDVPLVANEEGAIYTLIATYYNAMATGDEETLRSVCDEISDKDMYRYVELSQYIDYYPTLEIYTKTGPEEGSVIAYVYYKISFTGSRRRGSPDIRRSISAPTIRADCILSVVRTAKK